MRGSPPCMTRPCMAHPRVRLIPVYDSSILQEEYSRWYWEEDKSSLHLHNKFMIKAPCWVEYAGSVAAELEDAYQHWKDGPSHRQLWGYTPQTRFDITFGPFRSSYRPRLLPLSMHWQYHLFYLSFSSPSPSL